MTLSEKDFQLFKKWLKSHLAFGPVTVVFTKKDGTERVMECTTSSILVPAEPIVEGAEPKREKKVNEDVMPVYDLESKHWKSFRWDSVKEVKFVL
jgi:hypothetical protein